MNPERIAQKELRKKYGALFDGISALLFRYDPVGINHETNRDEYDPEAGTILPRLRDCCSESDALRVVHEEFCRWFDAGSVGPVENYVELTREIWTLWREKTNLPNHPLAPKPGPRLDDPLAAK